MRNFILAILAMGFTVITVSSCYYDNEALLYGTSKPCTDTVATISYAQKIVPLFQQSCYSCHTSGSPGGGIVMGTYTTDKALVTNGKLYGCISHASGFSAMPKSAAKFSVCNIAVIKKWIDAGAPNN